MELSERIIQALENEGYTDIQERSVVAGRTIDEPASSHEIIIIFTDGTGQVMYEGETTYFAPGDRITIPADTPYQVTADTTDCHYILGEK